MGVGERDVLNIYSYCPVKSIFIISIYSATSFLHGEDEVILKQFVGHWIMIFLNEDNVENYYEVE